MMELKENNAVYSADGEEIGKINRFVVNPVSKKVTHVVVQKGFFFPEDRVVPVDWIASVEEDRATLSKNAQEVQDLPPFEEVQFVSLDEEERELAAADTPNLYAPSYYWYPPYGTPAFAYPYYPSVVASEVDRNIPRKTVPLQEGADVISADGEHVGDVERLLLETDTNRTTHFLISQGLLLKERKLIPVEWVSRIEENKVHLGVGSNFLNRLPDFRE